MPNRNVITINRRREVFVGAVAFIILSLCSDQVVYGQGQSSYRAYRPSYRTQSAPTRPKYRLDAGDIVAVLIPGVTDEVGSAPVHLPSGNRDDIIPSVGYPYVVLSDGTLPVPWIDPVSVRGLTVVQARDKVRQRYVEERILRADHYVTMSLTRKRTVSVGILQNEPSYGSRSIAHVKLPADGASVLGALARADSFDPNASMSIIRSRGSEISPRNPLRDGDVVRVHSAPRQRFIPAESFRAVNLRCRMIAR